jgi:hypothetical protein
MIKKIYNTEIEIANLELHQSIKLSSIESSSYKSELWVTRVFKGLMYEQRIFSFRGEHALSTTSQFVKITKHELDIAKNKEAMKNED